MKHIDILKSSILTVTFACLSAMFAACQDDITIPFGSQNAFDNVEGTFGSVRSAAGAKALTTININGDKAGTGHLYFELSKAADKDITVTFKVDEAALTAYNDANGTSYVMYPANKLTLENDGIVTIPAGKRKSASIELNISSGGTVGSTYAIAVSATASDGIDMTSNNQSYIYLVKPLAAIPDSQKGDVKTLCYIEVNNENILNVGEYTMKESGKPFFDIVSVFAANIRLNAEGKPYIHCNPQVTFVLENADKLIRPLQEKGIKVNLSILGDHTPAGMRSLGNEAAKDFAKELKAYVDIYGFDGIDFDDEYSAYDKVPGHPGLVTASQEQYSHLVYECRQIMPNTSLGIYWYQSNDYPRGDIEGKTVNEIVDYAVYGTYGGWRPLSTDLLEKKKQCPYAIRLSNGISYNTSYLNNIKADWGYFAFYDLQSSKIYDTKINEIGKLLYNDEVVWSGQVYGRTDFTSSETTARIDYKYYLGEWEVTSGTSFKWNNTSWNSWGGTMKYNIRIEENVKDESYYVYGWAPPYNQITDKYPLVMNYIAETASLSIPIPQTLHEPDATDPLLWQLCLGTLGDQKQINSWKREDKEGTIVSSFGNSGGLYLDHRPATNSQSTMIPFCSNDNGTTWLYIHTNFGDQHPKNNFTLKKK